MDSSAKGRLRQNRSLGGALLPRPPRLWHTPSRRPAALEPGHGARRRGARTRSRAGRGRVVGEGPLLCAVRGAGLKTVGVGVLRAATGEGGLRVMAGGGPVGVLFTDIRRAGRLDGWDVSEKFRVK